MSRPAALATAALHHAATVLGTLTAEQLEDLATGRGRLEFRAVADAAPSGAPPPARAPDAAPRRAAPSGIDVEAAAAEIRRLTSSADVREHLQQQEFTLPVLREIAKALGPTVSASARTKADLQRNIVEGTTGFRTRSAAMSGGAWS